MSVSALFQAGRLSDTLEALSADLRNDPTDVRKRTFLFELLCFAGEFDRAERHLDLLADVSHEASLGAWLYRSALHAERVRQQMFVEGTVPREAAGREPVAASVNGSAFADVADADPRIGARLEVFAAGQYMLIPFPQLASVRMEAPKRLRDLMWAPARVMTSAGFRGMELGEVLIPVLSPLTWRHPDDEIRLGRATDWETGGDGAETPVGLKLLRTDEQFLPFPDLRTVEFSPPQND